MIWRPRSGPCDLTLTRALKNVNFGGWAHLRQAVMRALSGQSVSAAPDQNSVWYEVKEREQRVSPETTRGWRGDRPFFRKQLPESHRTWQGGVTWFCCDSMKTETKVRPLTCILKSTRNHYFFSVCSWLDIFTITKIYFCSNNKKHLKKAWTLNKIWPLVLPFWIRSPSCSVQKFCQKRTQNSLNKSMMRF